MEKENQDLNPSESNCDLKYDHTTKNGNHCDPSTVHSCQNLSMKVYLKYPQEKSYSVLYQIHNTVYRAGPEYEQNHSPLNQLPENLASYRNGDLDRRERGGYDPPGFTNTPFEDRLIRKKFVSKVYFILTLQFLVTLGFVWMFNASDLIQEFAYDYWWVAFIFMGVFIIIYFVLVCVEKARRSYPMNFILLGLLTLSQSFVAGIISSAYDTLVVLYAIGITTLIFLVVTLLAKFAPCDVTGCGMVCCILSCGLCMFGSVCMIVMFFTRVPILHLIYSGLAVVVFTLYILYDTQMIMGGRRIELSPEEYILAAVQLYVDVVQIFYNLLILIGACFEK